MRCLACNRPLFDEEATNYSYELEDYVDMCWKCLYPEDYSQRYMELRYGKEEVADNEE